MKNCPSKGGYSSGILKTVVDHRNKTEAVNNANRLLQALPANDGPALDQFVHQLAARLVVLHMQRSNNQLLHDKLRVLEDGLDLKDQDNQKSDRVIPPANKVI